MIQFACPTCGFRFNVQDSYAGRTATCKNCGGQMSIPGPSSAPPARGVPPPAPPSPPAPGYYGPPTVSSASSGVNQRQTISSGVATAGFICGLIGLVLSFGMVIPCVGCWLLPLASPTALAGLICSIIGLIQAKKAAGKNSLAVAGLILAIVALVWAPIAFFLFLFPRCKFQGSRTWPQNLSFSWVSRVWKIMENVGNEGWF